MNYFDKQTIIRLKAPEKNYSKEEFKKLLQEKEVLIGKLKAEIDYLTHKNTKNA